MSINDIMLTGVMVSMIGLSACSSAPPPAQAQADVDEAAIDRKLEEAARSYTRVERDGVLWFCQRERTIGTNIKARKCLTESQLRVQLENMERTRDDLRNRAGKCTRGRLGTGGPCGGS